MSYPCLFNKELTLLPFNRLSNSIIPRQRLQVDKLSFNKQGKWRLSDGANIHWYAMEDNRFVRDIQQGKRFGIDDILVCQVVMTQRIDDGGKLKLEYAVQQVLEHIEPGKQVSFPQDSDSA